MYNTDNIPLVVSRGNCKVIKRAWLLLPEFPTSAERFTGFIVGLKLENGFLIKLDLCCGTDFNFPNERFQR